MTKILLVGCGKMGGALLRGWKAGATYDVLTVDPVQGDVAGPEALPESYAPDAVVLAIKPQNMADVLPAYARFERSLFLSIAAGVTLNRLSALLGGERALLRAMPNLPASIGEGVSVVVANATVGAAQKELGEALLRAAGDVAWVEDEALIDAVTALSGSGPAYFFALVEAMAAAGEKLGLARSLAEQLARRTLIGSGALLAGGGESATDLRVAVTSPGGTTAAALQHLMGADGLFPLLERAMQAAAHRARALS